MSVKVKEREKEKRDRQRQRKTLRERADIKNHGQGRDAQLVTNDSGTKEIIERRFPGRENSFK